MRTLIVAAILAVPHTSPPQARPPAWWTRDALCIHSHEAAWNANTGNGFYGGMQFLLSTWAAVGGRIRPDLATPNEQLYRAWLLWRLEGWHPWPNTARRCGLL